MAKAMLQRFQNMSAISMWNISEAEFPATGSPQQKLAFALKYAALAPTEGNSQSWQFRMSDTHIELWAISDPTMEAADPEGRELTIDCGSALLCLKLALKHFGCLGRVEVFPDLGERSLVARVHFGFGTERDPQENMLFKAMTCRSAQNSPLGQLRLSS